MQNRKGPTEFAFTVALAAALLCSFGCSGISNSENMGPPPNIAERLRRAQNTYLYVSQFYGNSDTVLGQFQMARNGDLTPIGPFLSPIIGPSVVSVAVDPSGKYLFAASFDSTTIFQFEIDRDGTLSPNPVPTLNVDGIPYSISFTPNGRFAIVTIFGSSISGSSVNSYKLSPSGALTLISTVATGNMPESSVIDRTGRFVYVGNYGDGTLSEYTLSASGVLAPIAPNNTIAGGQGIYQIAMSPKGFVYSANLGPNGTTQMVTEFAINKTTGALKNAGSFMTGTGSNTGVEWIAFDPAGKYAYVSNGSDYSVSQFTVDSTTGALARNGADVPVGGYPFQIAIDPTGKFAFTANQDQCTVSRFTISSTGSLAFNGTMSLQCGPYTLAFAQR